MGITHKTVLPNVPRGMYKKLGTHFVGLVPLKFLERGANTSKIQRDVAQLQSAMANISGTDPDTDNQKTAFATTKAGELFPLTKSLSVYCLLSAAQANAFVTCALDVTTSRILNAYINYRDERI